MSQFPIPNRQRRRSNLGKRNRTNENLPRMAPVFPVPVVRGLGRSKSAKKATTTTNLEKPSASALFAKKRLFLLSPQNQGSSYTLQELVGPPRIKQQSSLSPLQPQSIDLSLNETGVNVLITTPSPNDKSNMSQSQTSSWEAYTSQSQTSSWEAYLNRNKVEQPKSPKLSHYSQFIFSKYGNLKPPIDPDDNVEQMKSLSISNSAQTSVVKAEGVKEPSASVVIDKIDNSSDSINEDLDTTDSFILAEQTIIDQNQTLAQSPQAREPASDLKSIIKSNTKRLEPVIEEDLDSEDELLQETLTKLNTMMVEIENTKKLVHTLIRKRRKRKTNVENKENFPTTANKQIKDKWMSELKSENPGLLKTPKPLSKDRLSLAQQCTWTPHSLSFVLNDQMDNLFE